MNRNSPRGNLPPEAMGQLRKFQRIIPTIPAEQRFQAPTGEVPPQVEAAVTQAAETIVQQNPSLGPFYERFKSQGSAWVILGFQLVVEGAKTEKERQLFERGLQNLSELINFPAAEAAEQLITNYTKIARSSWQIAEQFGQILDSGFNSNHLMARLLFETNPADFLKSHPEMLEPEMLEPERVVSRGEAQFASTAAEAAYGLFASQTVVNDTLLIASCDKRVALNLVPAAQAEFLTACRIIANYPQLQPDKNSFQPYSMETGHSYRAFPLDPYDCSGFNRAVLIVRAHDIQIEGAPSKAIVGKAGIRWKISNQAGNLLAIRWDLDPQSGEPPEWTLDITAGRLDIVLAHVLETPIEKPHIRQFNTKILDSSVFARLAEGYANLGRRPEVKLQQKPQIPLKEAA